MAFEVPSVCVCAALRYCARAGEAQVRLELASYRLLYSNTEVAPIRDRTGAIYFFSSF